MNKIFIKIGTAAAVLMAVFVTLTACNAGDKTWDDIKRELGGIPGTFYNYGVDGQVVFEAHCRSIAFTRDQAFDRSDDKGDKIEDGSVIKVSCGDEQFSTVGFTSVYISDAAQSFLFADSQKFADVRVTNNDRSIPLVNFIWRDVKDLFTGTAAVVQVCDQNNIPILAFAAKGVTPYATDVAKSTMFKLDGGNEGDAYVWVSRGSYNRIDAKLLDSTQF